MRRDTFVLCAAAAAAMIHCDPSASETLVGDQMGIAGMGGAGGEGLTMGQAGMGGEGETFGCDDCDPLASCDDSSGAAVCTCPAGYSDPNLDGTLCSNIDECATMGHDCDPAVGICSDAAGSFSCACPAGYLDTHADGSQCDDIDECTTAADDCDATVGLCTNLPGTFSCACPVGYDDVMSDGSQCDNIDECTVGGHDCDAVVGLCSDTDGSFTCECPAGYDDVNLDGSQCDNIDECTAATDDCDPVATCLDLPGDYACECPVNTFDEHGDGTECKPIDVYGASPFQPYLFEHTGDTFAAMGCIEVTSAAGTITGVTAMTKHPQTGLVYAVAKVSASGRHLGTLDLATGVFTDIGLLGNNFSTIQFSPDGATLYGVTGNGGTPPETLFTIDAVTATPAQIQTLGNGADGELIAFDGSGQLFHWSGNGTVETEKINIGVDTTPVVTGGAGGEIFGAVWWPTHVDALNQPEPLFLISDISSNLRTMTAEGVYGTPLASTLDDLRGLVFEKRHGYVMGAAGCVATP
jgi:hypothetical protein